MKYLRGLHQEILCTAALCTSLSLKTHDAFQNPNCHAIAKTTNRKQTNGDGQIQNPNGKGGIITYFCFACQTDHKNTIAVWTARANIFAARFQLWSLPTVPDLLLY